MPAVTPRVCAPTTSLALPPMPPPSCRAHLNVPGVEAYVGVLAHHAQRVLPPRQIDLLVRRASARKSVARVRAHPRAVARACQRPVARGRRVRVDAAERLVLRERPGPRAQRRSCGFRTRSGGGWLGPADGRRAHTYPASGASDILPPPSPGFPLA